MELVDVTINGKYFREKEKYYGGAIIIDSPSNCKLSSVEFINELFRYGRNTLEDVKELFSHCRILVAFNTNSMDIVNFFRNNFEIYSEIKIPVGYNNGYQYHIIVRNTETKHHTKGYMRKLETPDIKEGTPINKENLEQFLTQVLKSKRRKTDIVTDIMAKI